MEWGIIATIVVMGFKNQLLERGHYAKKRVLREIKRRWGNPH